MRVLGEFHSTIGGLVRRFEATVSFLEGDGVQLFFNDPIEAEVEDTVEVEPVGEFTLKGFQRPVAAFNVVAVRETAVALTTVESA